VRLMIGYFNDFLLVHVRTIGRFVLQCGSNGLNDYESCYTNSCAGSTL
jgi:hypothetical protein